MPSVRNLVLAAAGLLGLPYTRVRRVVEALLKSKFAPVEPAAHGELAACHGHVAASPKDTEVIYCQPWCAPLWGRMALDGEEFVRLL